MGKILNAVILAGVLYGGFTYLKHVDTQKEEEIIEINITDIAEKTRPARNGLTSFIDSFFNKENQTLEAQTQESQEQYPKETIQEYKPKRPYPQRFHRNSSF